jgi:hypothetical protein
MTAAVQQPSTNWADRNARDRDPVRASLPDLSVSRSCRSDYRTVGAACDRAARMPSRIPGNGLRSAHLLGCRTDELQGFTLTQGFLMEQFESALVVGNA